jgi:hypothetical protein
MERMPFRSYGSAGCRSSSTTDVSKDKIRFGAAHVLIDLRIHEIVKNYKVSREQPVAVIKSIHMIVVVVVVAVERPVHA